MPTWLDGRTIAVVTTTITAALALAAMLQTAHSRLGNDIRNVQTELSNDIRDVRTELSNDINRLDDRLRSVEVGIATIQTTMAGLDTRLRVVEQHARHADEMPGPDQNGG